MYFVGEYIPSNKEVTKSKIILKDAVLIADDVVFDADCQIMWWGIESFRSEVYLNACALNNSYQGIFFHNQVQLVINFYQIDQCTFHNNLHASIEDNITGPNATITGTHVRGCSFSGYTHTMLEPYHTQDYYPLSFLMFSGDWGNLTSIDIRNNLFDQALSGVCQGNGNRLRINGGNNFQNCMKASILSNGYLIAATSGPNTIHVGAGVGFTIPAYNHTYANSVLQVPMPSGIAIIATHSISSLIRGFTISGDGPLAPIPQSGIYSITSTQNTAFGWNIEYNTIQDCTYGINDNGHRGNSQPLAYNTFLNNTYQFYLRAGNSTLLSPARYQMRCNDFVKTTATTQMTYGIFIEAGAAMNGQGSCPTASIPLLPAGNEFLPDGYPLSYSMNGTVANFAPGYDWDNLFTAIANNGLAPSFSYNAYENEHLNNMLNPLVGTAYVVCGNNASPPVPILATTSTCPTAAGVSNRSSQTKYTDSHSAQLESNGTKNRILNIASDQIESLHWVNVYTGVKSPPLEFDVVDAQSVRFSAIPQGFGIGLLYVLFIDGTSTTLKVAAHESR